MESKSYVFVVVALIIGLGGGYFYGVSAGKEQGKEEGRTALLAEQEAAAEAEAAKVAEDIQKAANPFAEDTTVNPFSEESNPLEGVFTNPFAR